MIQKFQKQNNVVGKDVKFDKLIKESLEVGFR